MMGDFMRGLQASVEGGERRGEKMNDKNVPWARDAIQTKEQ